MLKRLGIALAGLALLLMVGLGLMAFAPRYSALIAGSTGLFASDAVELRAKGAEIEITRQALGGPDGDQVITTSGYLLQLSYFVLLGVAFIAWRLELKKWWLWTLATIPVIFAAHLAGAWMDTHDVTSEEGWVQVSRMMSFLWMVIPAVPLVVAVLLRRHGEARRKVRPASVPTRGRVPSP